MVKSLFLLSALLGVNSMPVASNSNDQYYGVQERQCQHTEDVGNTEVTYKYESNEVSSVDDLIVGNIYSIDITGSTFTENVRFTRATFVHGFSNNNVATLDVDNYDADYFNIVYLLNYDVFEVSMYYDGSLSNVTYRFAPHDLVFQYHSNINTGVIGFIGHTDYNEIVSVSYIPPTTIFGHLAEVLGDNLYGGIPNVDNVIFSIGGQDITLKSWLVTSTCIVLAVVLITILCLFIRWLFKLFSNTILLR